ncbi:hypothetical protein EN852_011290 [Mesorhizobium sp. M2E.F.Ca.ET.209.01.1.1]|uniref:hypothetical protein n=1 Tax=Mesorhizobium sp. M2E.F.Ca.ET.209.01.1.1 TaxID=2500526 RepID=UPI000FDB23BE|nr:hypothetical protein [Mesorhizobium sp. M2E.F.Ca.ET.209.01.1.1]TGS16182.1 hypothetical protein EN852_011290 [Mesorhizobium sp. M2E.F.Ca.ET.209.01.1.1]
MSSASASSRNAMRRVIVTAICLAAATGANAHDWYQNKVDPVTNFKCCGGTDCRPIPESSVQSRADGGYVYLPDGFNIPRDRVQESPDGRYHICENHYVITNQPYLRCFFAPRLKVSRLFPR